MTSASGPVSEVFSWLVTGGAVLGPPAAFLGFLWFFRATRAEFQQTVICPEKGGKARIDVIAREGAKGPYYDIKSCPLLTQECPTCGKACLRSDEFVEEPFKDRLISAEQTAKPK